VNKTKILRFSTAKPTRSRGTGQNENGSKFMQARKQIFGKHPFREAGMSN